MGIRMSVVYHPKYQRRSGTKCAHCKFEIEVGGKVMEGTGFYNGISFKVRYHWEPCFRQEYIRQIADGFFEHPFEKLPKYSESQQSELESMRLRLAYLNKKGVGDNVEARELEAKMQAIKDEHRTLVNEAMEARKFL